MRVLLAIFPCGLAIALVASFTGCPSGNNRGPIAGQAWVENEQGEKVPATIDGTSGRRSAPVHLPSGSDAKWLKHFELTERSGKLVNSESLKGQPYVVGFFFSTCPTICKRQNEKVAELQRKFKGQPVKLLSISCDPEVDVPEVLTKYAEGFRADAEQWLFLTGDLAYIRRVGAEMYFLPVDRRFHAEKLLLVDGDGEIYDTYNWNLEERCTQLHSDIAAMLKAGGRLPKKPEAESQSTRNPEDL